MPKLNIDGIRVSIGDEFLKMSPAEQEAFVQNVVIPSPEFQAKKAGASEPKKPAGTERGMAETFARGAAQGASFNFGDEIAGLRNAASDKIPDFIPIGPLAIPARTIAGAMRTGFNALTGMAPGAQQDYEQGRDQFRTALKEGEAQNPITSAAGNITGALAGSAFIPGGAATLPLRARTGLSALAGLASGAASGAGEGETFEERAKGALWGGAIGGGVGAAAPGVIDAVSAVARPFASRAANMVRGFRDPEGEAARRTVTGIAADREVDPQAVTRLTNREFAQSAEAGDPVALMDLGGESTRALARSAANQSPEGRAILNQNISDRFTGQSGRVNQWFRSTFHYPDADAQAEALKQASRDVNKPAYAKAYSDGSNMAWDETFEQIAQAPEVQGAIRKAMVNAKSEAAKMGFTPPKNPFFFDETSGRLKLRTEGENTMTPNLQFWDIVKRNLDRGDRNSQDWAKILRDRLDEITPSYQQARAGAAHFFDAEDALEAGQKFLNKNMTPSQARRALSQMTEQERQLFQDGFVSKYMEMLDNVGDKRDVLNKIAESPAARAKLNIALGPERAAQLEAKLRIEGLMNFARNAVGGNSTTTRQLVELGLAGSGAGIGVGLASGEGVTSPTAIISALLSAGAAKGKQRIDGNVARKIADLLVSRNPNDLQRGADIIAKNARLMDALRGADKHIARVAGEEGSGRPEEPDNPKRIYITGNQPAP